MSAKAELEALQNRLLLDKIERARAMTREERIAEVFEASDDQLQMMLGGAMKKLGTTDENEGWEEVRRWIERLDKLRTQEESPRMT